MNDQRNTARATVAIHVDVAGDTAPGVVAVLLDLLARSGVRATWSLPLDADAALSDRLRLEGHAVSARNASNADDGPGAGTEAPTWLHGVQIAIGRALETRTHTDVRIDTAGLDRSANIVEVGEALDLVRGLVRAGRLHVVTPARASGSLDPPDLFSAGVRL